MRSLAVASLVLCLGFVGQLMATQPKSQEYNLTRLEWRNVGPNRGGRSTAVAGSPSRPFEYYFGAAGGGLWKTTDGGSTWKPVTDGQIASSSVGAVAVSESNPDVVYIGTGETELRASIIQGDGVYKSVNGGQSWSYLGLSDTQAIARIRVDPGNPDLIYVAALGHPFGANEERGVFRSLDGGKSWQKVLFRNNHAGAVDLCLDPHDPRVIFASLWDVYRKPWTLSSGGPGSGLFKSENGGDSWTEITRNPGMPDGVVGKIGVSVSPADSKRVYALIEAKNGGLFRSDDAGKTWILVNNERKIWQRAFYFSRVVADPKDRDAVYILNVELYKSTDAGKTLSITKTLHDDHHDLWIASNQPERMISADDGGGSVSVNYGKTWTPETYPTAQIYHVAATHDSPYHICGAQQDTTTACVPSDAALNLRDPEAPPGQWLYAVGGGEEGYIAAHPLIPNLFYAGGQAGELTRYDRKTGQKRDIRVYPLFFSGMPAKSLIERWQWTFPIIFARKDSNTLYAASQHLWKTQTDGQSWERISPDLTRHDPSTLGDSGGPITKDQNGPEIFGTIFAIAPSYQEDQTIWTGSDDGMVYITRDGGKSWTNITPPGLPGFSRISLIEASTHREGTAYLAANRYQLDDLSPYIFKTDNYGKTWSQIVDGILSKDFVHAVREDPVREGLLYAGTEHGVYFSFNNGDHWQSLSLNLPDTRVPDLVIHDDDLIIATHGRSFYVLDAVGVLRQLTPDVLESKAHLFKPGAAMRPRKPAIIEYYLNSSVHSLLISILDTAGRIVRVFDQSSEIAEHKNQSSAQRNPGSADIAATPGGKMGLNRLVWDLRYPGATVFEGMILGGAHPELGPLAPPGHYQVCLAADEKIQIEPLEIEWEGRISEVTDGDLEEQFKLASEVRDAVSEANHMVLQIRGIKAQVAAYATKANDYEISAAGERLAARVGHVEEQLYQVRNRSSKDIFNFPIKLNNELAVLFEIVETGDARPTDQSYVVFHELSAVLATLTEEMREILKNDLAHFNNLLMKHNLGKVQLD